MIPGPFAYHRPTSVADAVALMAQLGDTARPLAGGHSLIPMMKLRMAVPDHLIDLAGIADLKGICEDGDSIVIGAATTQAQLIRSEVLAARIPLLRETALQIADPQIRAKGTLGGNVANGDPGNDMPAVMQCLDASFTLAGPAGVRHVPARDFFEGIYATAALPGELLTAIRIKVPAAGHGHAYEKLKRKIGDYATAAAAVVLTMDGQTVTDVSIALTNVGPTPLLASAAMDRLRGAVLDAAAIKEASALAKAITDPATDGRGTAEYRTQMAGVMTARALQKAAARAAQGA